MSEYGRSVLSVGKVSSGGPAALVRSEALRGK
jgi:hypothetical protein